jgi:signal transduction histidine kinase
LEQIFGNLLGNACKYSGSGSRISASAEVASPEEVAIRVSDDGVGIDSELLPNIFDLFVESSRTLDRSHGGLGIGLTIVHRMVILHGGTIQARSDGPGRGAEFIIHLPVPDYSVAVSPPVAVPAPGERPLRTLIVDDNEDAAESMAILQQLHGHHAQYCHFSH